MKPGKERRQLHHRRTVLRCGAEVRVFTLTLNGDLTYRGCRECMAWRMKLDRCAVEDDLTPVLEAIREADAPAPGLQVRCDHLSSR